MKILVCHNHYRQPGGEDRVFEEETALLERHGHAVVRYTRHNDELDRMDRAATVRATFSNPVSERALDDIVAAERPDVMHCHNTFPLISPAAYRAARRHGTAVVQTLHNYRLICPKAELMRENRPCEDCVGRAFAWPGIAHGCYRGSRLATGLVAGMVAEHRRRGTWTNAVDRYISLTRFARDRFVAGGLPARRIAVKPNFVAGAPEPGDGGGGYAVFVGRLSPEKGIDTLLQAWARLPDDLELRIVGDGPLAGMVREAAARDRRVVWMGRRSSAEVLETIGAARLLVMPSIWYETFGLCIVEAFAKGTPVVASRLGAMAELVEHDRTGLLFKPGDCEDLARTVHEGCASGRLDAMRGDAQHRYERSYSAERAYPLLMDVYDEAIAAAGRTA